MIGGNIVVVSKALSFVSFTSFKSKTVFKSSFELIEYIFKVSLNSKHMV